MPVVQEERINLNPPELMLMDGIYHLPVALLNSYGSLLNHSSINK